MDAGDAAPPRSGSVAPITVVVLGIGVVGISLSGPLIAAATTVPALAMAFWRSALGAAATAPAGLGHARRRELRSLSARSLAACSLAGVLLAGHFALWTAALKLTSVASATALVCLQAGWVVVGMWLLGTPVRRGVWGGLALALAGVLVVSGVDLSTSSRAVFGDLLALGGGILGGGYVYVGGRIRPRLGTAAYTAICYATSAATLAVAAVAAGVALTGFGVRGWLLVLAVTVAAQLLGHTGFNHALATVSATVVSMVMLLEVPGAAILAAAFLGQTPPAAVYAGLALICAGLAIVVRAGSSTMTPASR